MSGYERAGSMDTPSSASLRKSFTAAWARPAMLDEHSAPFEIPGERSMDRSRRLLQLTRWLPE
jgi:hypothetical protein